MLCITGMIWVIMCLHESWYVLVMVCVCMCVGLYSMCILIWIK